MAQRRFYYYATYSQDYQSIWQFNQTLGIHFLCTSLLLNYGTLPLIPNIDHYPILLMIGGVLEFTALIILCIYCIFNCIASTSVLHHFYTKRSTNIVAFLDLTLFIPPFCVYLLLYLLCMSLYFFGYTAVLSTYSSLYMNIVPENGCIYLYITLKVVSFNFDKLTKKLFFNHSSNIW